MFLNALRASLAALFLLVAGGAHAMDGYETLPLAGDQRTDGKVEVIKFFWYGCPHCYAAEPTVNSWVGEKPDNVVFRREAPPLNQGWTVHSQAFYAAQLMGVLDEFHDAFFNEIHQNKNRMRRPSDIGDFVETLGIDSKKFMSTMKSFAVQGKIQNSMKLAQKFRLTGVPTVIVDGRYKTGGSIAGSYPRMMEVVGSLAADVTGS